MSLSQVMPLLVSIGMLGASANFRTLFCLLPSPCSGALKFSCAHIPPAPACLDAFWPCCDGKGCLRALRTLKEVLGGVRALQIYRVVAGHHKSVNLKKFASGMCGFKG